MWVDEGRRLGQERRRRGWLKLCEKVGIFGRNIFSACKTGSTIGQGEGDSSLFYALYRVQLHSFEPCLHEAHFVLRLTPFHKIPLAISNHLFTVGSAEQVGMQGQDRA